MQTIDLTTASLDLFVMMWLDAPNWRGTPLIGGNFDLTKEERGNLTDLKRRGLVTTSRSDGETWVHFTDEGVAFAASLELQKHW
jgi:hypothetical protein